MADGSGFVSIFVTGMKLRVREGLPREWFPALLAHLETAPKHSRFTLPDGTNCFAKIYRRRPSHSIFRRMLPGRAMREGRGFLEFRRAGLPTVPLLAFGEKRSLGLFDLGLVLTVLVPAPTVADAFTEADGPALLTDSAEFLGKIHRAGLCHGDPRARNFIAGASGLLAFDLASYGPCRPKNQAEDVVRLLSSALVLSPDPDLSADLLASYREAGPALDVPDAVILERARSEGVRPCRA
jgi:tRNA A-37 threonylcarbamoyl transferase component Bud32